MSYLKLFEKGKIGPLALKNRSVMVPMGTDFADRNGLATDRLIAYYEERAKGGIGLIINEYTGVDDVDSMPSIHNFRIAQDYHIAECERLTDAVHQYGCRIFAQLHHGGITSKPALTGRQSIGPSGIPAAPGGPVPKEMTLEDISRVQQKFVDAAVRCKKAGYDGVELHGAHGYLINEFFSRYYNRRTDEYGGSLENRMRFIAEIIHKIREELGAYPISVRICGDEMTPVEGFLTLEDGLEIGRYLEKLGIDAINISNGSPLNGNANCDPYSFQPGWKKHVAKAFKEALHIPVIATNTIKNPQFAEQLLQEGICDFVGLGRSQFADPEFMNKAREGRDAEIRQCIGCMVCRERLLLKGMPVECSVNPRLGREYKFTGYRRNGNGRTAAVIGGGPAGMEAARVLGERGFHVILFEKEEELGGTLNIADQPPFKTLITNLTETMKVQLEKLGVEIRLQTEATVEAVKAVSPVGVFIAVGADSIIPKLPGISLPKVLLAEDVIRNRVPVRGKALVVGTGLTGLETAEILLNQGVKVTLAEMQETVGPGIYKVVLDDLWGRIKTYEPEVFTGCRLSEVTKEGGILVRETDGTEIFCDADFVILALGIKPRTFVTETFENHFDKVIAIGNAGTPGQIFSAVKDGFDKANVFE